MSEEYLCKEDGRQMIEQNILCKILRLLAEEHLISLEEECHGKEIIRRESVQC